MAVRKRSWITQSGERRESWIVDYFDAAGDRHIRTFERKKEADAFRQDVGVAVRAGTHTAPSKSITVRQAAEQWIESVQLEGREETTVRQYQQHAAHINKRMGDTKLADLTAPWLNTSFKKDLLKTMSHVMARKVLSSLKSMLRHAQANGSVAQNVALAVKIKAHQRDKKKLEVGVDIPSTEEIKAILAAAGDARPLLLVAVFAGLRSSELRGLRWPDIDLKAGKLHVRQRADRYGKIGSPKSKAGHRTVPLAPDVVQALREWKLQCPKSGAHGLVFPAVSGDGVALHNNAVRAFTAAVRAAGIVDENGKPKFRGLHCLRHFYASWLINPPERGGLGLPPKVVQQLLGHSTIAQTMDTYSHLFPDSEDVHLRLATATRNLLG